MNQVTLIGRLVRDPERRTTTSGADIWSFTLAVNRNKEEVDFFDIKATGKTGDLVHLYLEKGFITGVTGTLRQERWEKEGKPQSRIVVWADRLELLPNKDRTVKPQDPTDDFQEIQEELPF